MTIATPLHLLLLEDTEADAELIVRELRRSEFAPVDPRVQTEADFIAQAGHLGLRHARRVRDVFRQHS